MNGEDYKHLDTKIDGLIETVGDIAVNISAIGQWKKDHKEEHAKSADSARWALRTSIAAACLVLSLLAYLGLGGS